MRQRIFCKPCLDWSERRYHVAGRVGTGLWRRCVDLGWLVRERDSRTVRLTAQGRAGLAETFGLILPTAGHAAAGTKATAEERAHEPHPS